MAGPNKDTSLHPVVLLAGEDDHAIPARAREILAAWNQAGPADQETIDGSVTNANDALRVLGRLREAIQTLPFPGMSKIVWLRHCNFIGEERTSEARAVVDDLTALADELKRFKWDGVRLLITTGKIDKRRAFYKTLEKLGTVESYAALSPDSKDWEITAERLVTHHAQGQGKRFSDEALGELIARVGPNASQLTSETEKLCLFLGDRTDIQTHDVEQVVTRQKHAKAFALAEALGDRNLRALLNALDDELWETRQDSERSEIGLLYGVISKVRILILISELLRLDKLKPSRDFNSFKRDLEKLDPAEMPADRRFNPLSINPYPLFKALPQARRYSQAELVQAMELLLECNRKLVSSSLDSTLVLQQTLIRIVSFSGQPASATRLTA